MAEMAFLSWASRDSGQHKTQMHKKTTTKPDLAMIDAPFFLDAARSVYVIVRLLAIQKSNGGKVFLRYCNRLRKLPML